MTRRPAVRLVMSFVVTTVVACGADANNANSGVNSPALAAGTSIPPPVVSTATVFGMESTVEHLDATSVADDAIRPEELQNVLVDSGFAGGVERSFSGGTGVFARVVARTLAFDTDAGAEAYLAWLRNHVTELIGTNEVTLLTDLPPGALTVRHLPDGCCPKEVPVYLVAWRRETFVLSVEASGQRARAAPMVSIVRAFDEEI